MNSLVSLRRLGFARVALVLGALVLGSCQRELHHDLAETEANEIVSALAHDGVGASKERDPSSKGRWMVTVGESDAPRAWSTLKREGLPRPSSQTFEDLYPRSGLLPSRSEEQVILQTATAGKLEESLRSLDGVVDARVHLVLPQPAALGKRSSAPPKASVLVKVKADSSAVLSEAMVAELVAYGAPDLEVDQVDVTIVPSGLSAGVQPGDVSVSFGPLQVAASSKGPLQATLAALVLGILALSAGVGFQTLKLRRLNASERAPRSDGQ